MNGENIMLSQWWKTESCQRAFERAKAKRQERIAAVRQAFAQRQEKLESEVQQWEEVRQ